MKREVSDPDVQILAGLATTFASEYVRADDGP